MDFRFDIVQEYLPYFGKGVIVTLEITIVSLLIGMILGLLFSLMNLTNIKVLRWFYLIYITILRGTPVLVQLFIFHLAILPLFVTESNAILSAIVTLSLNSGAYIAEIFRGAIESIDSGQDEAARSLGLSRAQSLLHVILPQAFKQAIPALGNEVIVLLKETSLASVIAAEDLLYFGKSAASQYFRVWEPYITVALIYLLLTITLTFFLRLLERRLDIG